MKARDMIDARIADLEERGLRTLVPPCKALRDVLGDLPLTAEAERTLEWLLRWDGTVLNGIAALVRQVKESALGLSRCSVCDQPVHASESDDLERCPKCRGPVEEEARTGKCSTCGDKIRTDGTCSHVRELLSARPR